MVDRASVARFEAIVRFHTDAVVSGLRQGLITEPQRPVVFSLVVQGAELSGDDYGDSALVGPLKSATAAERTELYANGFPNLRPRLDAADGSIPVLIHIALFFSDGSGRIIVIGIDPNTPQH